MAGRQITSRLKPEVKSRFTEYAAEFGFSDSELAKLLLLRESRQKQLQAAVSTGALAPSTGRASSKSKRPTITAHYSSAVPIEQFIKYVKSCSVALTRSEAAAWVLERELNERWLAAALSMSVAVPR